jgi:hypothetical protein
VAPLVKNAKVFFQASFIVSDVLRSYHWTRFFLGGNGEGEIPDSIPNSEVKPFIADGTARKSVGE